MRLMSVLAAFFVFSSGVLGADNSIGQVIAIDGRGVAVGADGNERQLALKSDIFMNDRVITAAGGKLQIRFNDDSIILQGEKSEMTIDQYVFNPAAIRENSCSLKMMKGVFRTITGKITELNPDRFKVKTNLATIGIRGCELGFRLQGNREDVYVINLPEGHSVIIEKLVADEAGKGGIMDISERILNIVNDGVAVTISSGVSLMERPVAPSENMQLMQDSTPAQSSGSADVVVDAAPGSDTAQNAVNDSVERKNQSSIKDNLLAEIENLKKEVQQNTSSKPKDNFIEPTSAPYVPPPETPPPVMVGGSPATTWSWGIWADGTVDCMANNTEFGSYEFLSSTDYQSIIAATASRLLAGSGDAAAVINGPGYYKEITGIGGVTFEVLIGNAVTPAWGGSFTLSGGSDSLTFSVNRLANGGLIDANGVLSLNPGVPLSVYTLVANGGTYTLSDLGAHSVNGTLIRPAAPLPSDIVGVTGSFNFQHPSASITVSGAYGADLF